MFASAVLLAAGASARFGSPKMLAALGGEPLLRRTARAFLEAGLEEVIAVLGARAAEVAAALDGLPVRMVLNSGWEHGMFSSVKKGLAAVDPRAERIAVSPADLPLLSAEAVRRVVEAGRRSNELTLVVPAAGGRRGHPLVFAAFVRDRLLSWPDSARLSDLLAEPDLAVALLEGFDAGVLRDADTPADVPAVPPAEPPRR